MIRSITVKAGENSSTNKIDPLTIDLFDPTTSGFAVTNITGLGPVNATINTTSYPTSDGAVYASARVDIRNIVMSLVFVPGVGETVEDIRHRSYTYFGVKRQVTLYIKTDSRELRISGYVEANEVDIFSERESTQISIICPNPYFYDDSTKQIVSFIEVEQLFHFPFYNDGVFTRSIKLGEIKHRVTKSFNYTGTVPVLCQIFIGFCGPITGGLMIKNKTETGEYQSMNINARYFPSGVSIQAGGTIFVGNLGGKYAAYQSPSGTDVTILTAIQDTSDWITLAPGKNEITVEPHHAEESENISAVIVIAPTRLEGV